MEKRERESRNWRREREIVVLVSYSMCLCVQTGRRGTGEGKKEQGIKRELQ